MDQQFIELFDISQIKLIHDKLPIWAQNKRVIFKANK